ncbi:unnamed protein product [Orchesella dallaii]|uniref:Uncharacterized protein n=1 Tax=Orchesella dallaii TaxID=48710 RepID=A0ABP1Q7K6_9HEXA
MFALNFCLLPVLLLILSSRSLQTQLSFLNVEENSLDLTSTLKLFQHCSIHLIFSHIEEPRQNSTNYHYISKQNGKKSNVKKFYDSSYTLSPLPYPVIQSSYNYIEMEPLTKRQMFEMAFYLVCNYNSEENKPYKLDQKSEELKMRQRQAPPNLLCRVQLLFYPKPCNHWRKGKDNGNWNGIFPNTHMDTFFDYRINHYNQHQPIPLHATSLKSFIIHVGQHAKKRKFMMNDLFLLDDFSPIRNGSIFRTTFMTKLYFEVGINTKQMVLEKTYILLDMFPKKYFLTGTGIFTFIKAMHKALVEVFVTIAHGRQLHIDLSTISSLESLELLEHSRPQSNFLVWSLNFMRHNPTIVGSPEGDILLKKLIIKTLWNNSAIHVNNHLGIEYNPSVSITMDLREIDLVEKICHGSYFKNLMPTSNEEAHVGNVPNNLLQSDITIYTPNHCKPEKMSESKYESGFNEQDESDYEATALTYCFESIFENWLVTQSKSNPKLKATLHKPSSVNETQAMAFKSEYFLNLLKTCKKSSTIVDTYSTIYKFYIQFMLKFYGENGNNTGLIDDPVVITKGEVKEGQGEVYENWKFQNVPLPSRKFNRQLSSLRESGLAEYWRGWLFKANLYFCLTFDFGVSASVSARQKIVLAFIHMNPLLHLNRLPLLI